MATKDNAYNMKEAINLLLRTYKIEGKYDESKVLFIYREVVGQMISKHTTSIKIKAGTLFITVDNAALRSELNFAREKLKDSLNQKIGKVIVEEIIFR